MSDPEDDNVYLSPRVARQVLDDLHEALRARRSRTCACGGALDCRPDGWLCRACGRRYPHER